MPSAPPPPAKKSRFALQREKERFKINFDDDTDGNGGVGAGVKVVPKLVGEIVERETMTMTPFSRSSAASTTTTGFPASDSLPPPLPSSSTSVLSSSTSDPLPLPSSELSDISSSNTTILSQMSEAEILEEQRKIKEELGLSEGVIKMLMNRKQKKVEVKVPEKVDEKVEARVGFRQREEVRELKKKQKLEIEKMQQLEEEEDIGSPEYIRKHFFPTEDPSNPSLGWMRPPPQPEASTSSTTLEQAYDLNGFPLDSTLNTPSIPSPSDSHISSTTTFTLSQLSHLTSSSVPSQRSTALLITHRILSKQTSSLKTRIEATKNATRCLRDNTLSVVTTSLNLLLYIFSFETPTIVEIPVIEGKEIPATPLSAFLDLTPFPVIASLLAPTSFLPSQSHLALLSLLNTLLILDPTLPPVLHQTPNFLSSFTSRFIALPYPSSSTLLSRTPTALSFLTTLSRYSRSIALSLHEHHLIEPPLRFLAIPPWDLSNESERTLGFELVEKTLEFWSVLGRYGIGCSVWTRGKEIIVGLIDRLTSSTLNEDQSELKWKKNLLELLSIWTITAIDPHLITGGEDHAILWSQVFEWGEIGVEVFKTSTVNRVKTKALELITAWVEGSKVNRSWKGEAERSWVRDEIKFDSIGEVIERLIINSEEIDDVSFLLARLRLSDFCYEEGEDDKRKLVEIEIDMARDLIGKRDWGRDDWIETRLLVQLLGRLEEQDPIRFRGTLNAIVRLRAGDEVVARELTDWVLKITEVQIGLLRPFVLHSIISSSGGKVTAPLFPTSKDIKLSSLQQLPSAPLRQLLQPDWPLGVLDELLRSGFSPVFERLPSNWEGSELDLVCNSLSVMSRIIEAQTGEETRPSASTMIYDLIKIFMLEKEVETQDGGGDLFRDDKVEALMKILLTNLRVGNQPTQLQLGQAENGKKIESLETVSTRFSSAPFYTLYTDLIALYESTSFSHPTFALILLPVLAMSYPVDYRRLLWTDYVDLLRTMKTTIEEVISDRPGQFALANYLWPVEKDETILGGYVEALVGKRITKTNNEFLYFIAVHHLSEVVFNEGRKRLASVLTRQGGKEVVNDLLRYHHSHDGQLLFPPECYEREDLFSDRRQRWAALLEGTDVEKLTESGF